MRDKRVTTHLALVGRVFGADGMYLQEDDKVVLESVKDINERWGGEFFVETVGAWKKFIKDWKGITVHLTMYGLQVDDVMGEIKEKDLDVLVVVGSEKVPPDIYKLADYNVAVGNQPHSEISALTIFLDRLHGGAELKKDFKGKVKIIPSNDHKRVITE